MSSNTQLKVFNKSARCFLNPKESFLACPTELKFLCRNKEDDCIADKLLPLFLTLQFCCLCDLYQMLQRVSSNCRLPSMMWTLNWSAARSWSTAKTKISASIQKEKKNAQKRLTQRIKLLFQWDLRLCAWAVLNSLENTEEIQVGIEVRCSQLDSNLSSAPNPQAWSMPHRLCFPAQSQNRDSPALSTVTQQLQIKGIGLFLFAPVKMLTRTSARLWSTDSRWTSERPAAALQLVPSASAHAWGCFTYL